MAEPQSRPGTGPGAPSSDGAPDRAPAEATAPAEAAGEPVVLDEPDETEPPQPGSSEQPGADPSATEPKSAEQPLTEQPVSEQQPITEQPLTDRAEMEQEATERPETELEAARRERDEYLDLLRRERAEFENFRRRSTRERMEALDRGAEHLASQLLGVLDNFAYVLQAADESADTQLAKGAQMVHDELWRTLSQAGLEEIPGTGEPFDPNWHEAMMQVPAEDGVDHPTVVDVLRRGYRFKGRVLRPASVSVAQ